MKSIIINILKFSVAATLIWYLLSSDKLNFGLVKEALNLGPQWIFCLLLLAIQAFASSFRWKFLLETKTSGSIRVKEMAKLTWIGLFFSSILPGAVTGDLIKLVYAKDLDKDLSRSFLITSALIDRIFGLIGLLILLGVFTLFNIQNILEITDISTQLISLNVLLFSGSATFIIILFLPLKLQAFILNIIQKIPLLGIKLAHLFENLWSIGRSKKVVCKCLTLSIALQFSNIFAFWILTSPHYSTPLPLDLVFTFIPLGLVTVAIPVAPAGIGVGHVAFDSLFQMMNVKGGASFFNLYFMCTLFINLLGIFPYLFSKKKHHLDEAKQFEEAPAS